jgi:hypothetical protein
VNTLPSFFLCFRQNAICLVLLFGLLPLAGGRAEEKVIGCSLLPGDNHRGLPLVRPALYSGKIRSLDPAGFRVEDRSYPPIQASQIRGWGTDPCYLEIESSPADPTLEGERWEVDARKSMAMPGFFALKAEPWNTRPDLPRGLAGASYSIRPHWTVARLFPPVPESRIQAGLLPEDSDQVWIFDLSVAKKHRGFYAARKTAGQIWSWRAVSRGSPSAQIPSPVIPPGHAWYFYREGKQNLNFNLIGEPRSCALRLPLQKGNNMIAPGQERPYPLGWLATPANGFRAAADRTLAERVSFFRNSRVDVFSFLATPSPDWVPSPGLRGRIPEQSSRVGPTDAIQVFKTQADPDFLIPLLP